VICGEGLKIILEVAGFTNFIDIMGNFATKSDGSNETVTTGDIGVHGGLNIKGNYLELSLFTGPELSLNLPPSNPFAKTWTLGTELTGEIADPLRWALQIAASWQWYNQLITKNGQTIQWSPGVQIPLQAGLELVIVDGKRTELSLQGLCGINPGWSRGAWSASGVCTGALHANF
jgi:hypothetical protein